MSDGYEMVSLTKFLTLECELPGDLVRTDSDSELGWGLRSCIFNMLPGPRTSQCFQPMACYK